jgi:hypothetical protein
MGLPNFQINSPEDTKLTCPFVPSDVFFHSDPLFYNDTLKYIRIYKVRYLIIMALSHSEEYCVCVLIFFSVITWQRFTPSALKLGTVHEHHEHPKISEDVPYSAHGGDVDTRRIRSCLTTVWEIYGNMWKYWFPKIGVPQNHPKSVFLIEMNYIIYIIIYTHYSRVYSKSGFPKIIPKSDYFILFEY